MQLTVDNVESLFRACLRNEGNVVEGIMIKAYMDAEGQEENIASLLSQLPDSFQKTGGGGFSFLGACETQDGEQWTGQHQMMEKLFMLGFASGKANFCLPREAWSALPGGMPYITVDPAAIPDLSKDQSDAEAPEL